jgi:poly-beta-1,6-N-acetyl-D-glucosamine biosynthesis protein PgaD
MKPLQTFKTWPPLVNATGLPLFVRVRDTVLTLCAWGLLGYLLRDALYLAWDYFKYPIFELTTASPPDWRAMWLRLSNYALFIAAMMAWLLVWGHFRRATMSAATPQPQPPDLPPGQHAQTFELDAVDIQRWQTERRLVVHFDDAGRIKPASTDTA